MALLSVDRFERRSNVKRTGRVVVAPVGERPPASGIRIRKVTQCVRLFRLHKHGTMLIVFRPKMLYKPEGALPGPLHANQSLISS